MICNGVDAGCQQFVRLLAGKAQEGRYSWHLRSAELLPAASGCVLHLRHVGPVELMRLTSSLVTWTLMTWISIIACSSMSCVHSTSWVLAEPPAPRQAVVSCSQIQHHRRLYQGQGAVVARLICLRACSVLQVGVRGKACKHALPLSFWEPCCSSVAVKPGKTEARPTRGSIQ